MGGGGTNAVVNKKTFDFLVRMIILKLFACPEIGKLVTVRCTQFLTRELRTYPRA